MSTTATYTTMHADEMQVRIIGTIDPWDRGRLKVEVTEDRSFPRTRGQAVRYSQGETFWVYPTSLTMPAGDWPRSDTTTRTPIWESDITTQTIIWACCVSSIGPACRHKAAR